MTGMGVIGMLVSVAACVASGLLYGFGAAVLAALCATGAYIVGIAAAFGTVGIE